MQACIWINTAANTGRAIAVICAGLACLGTLTATGVQPAKTRKARPAAASKPAIRADADGYVGSRVCATCHRGLYDSFRRTPMGQSLTPAGDADPLKALTAPVRIYSQKLRRYFEVYRQGDQYFQKEYALDSDGSRLFEVSHPLAYAIGSNLEGITFLIQQGGNLFQAPLSYYRRIHAWDLSPGYEDQDTGFTRPVTLRCLACHSGRSQPADVEAGSFRNPVFWEEAIGCENCHGPGLRHATEWSHGKGDPLHPAIVNPLRLSPRLSEDICIRCHQGADVKVLRSGKTLLDTRPGQPLYDVLVLFNKPDSGRDPQKVLLAHVLSMRVSKCFRASGGKLTCISCHDPHTVPSLAERVAYFRNRCLNCHTEQSCKLPLATRQQQHPADSCVDCHMPKRPVDGIGHAALTDHHILARPDEPLAPGALLATTLEAPDLVQINFPPGPHRPLDDVTLLQAYWELQQSDPSYRPAFERQLQRCQQREPHDAVVTALAGDMALQTGTPAGLDQAAQDFSAALGRPTPFGAKLYAAMAQTLAQQGNFGPAAQILLRARQRFPLDPTLLRELVLVYLRQGDTANAYQAGQEYLDLMPQDLGARRRLSTLTPALPPQHE